MIRNAKNVRVVANSPVCADCFWADEPQSADRTDDAADDQALHLEGEHVLAEGTGGVLVLADAPQHATPRAAHQRPDERGDECRQAPADDHHEQPVAVDRLRAHVEAGGVVDRVEVFEERRPSVAPVGAARQPREARRVQEEADDLGDRDRDDGEVVGAKPQRRQAECERQQHRAHEHERQGPVPRPAVRDDRNGEGVGPDRREAGLAEVQQTGVADVDVESGGDDAVAGRRRTDGGVQGVPEDQVPVHPILSLLPSRPWGLMRSTRISTASAPTVLRSLALGTIHVQSSTKMPMMRLPSSAPNGLPETPERDGGEHQQQQREAHVPLDAELEPVEHAAQTGERTAENPHEQDHPIGVDAARRRQVGVVGDRSNGLAEPGLEQEERDADDHEGRRPDDEQRSRWQIDRPDRDRVALQRVLLERLEVAAEEVEEEVSQGECDTDRHDHHRRQAGSSTPQRPPQTLVEARLRTDRRSPPRDRQQGSGASRSRS